MGSSAVDVGPRLAVILLALVAAGAGRLSGLGQERPVAVAVLRGSAQLAAVSALFRAHFRMASRCRKQIGPQAS